MKAFLSETLGSVLRIRHDLGNHDAVAVFILQDDGLLDRIVVLVHRDRASTDLEVFRLLEGLLDLLRITAASALDGIGKHLAGIIAESCEDIRHMAVLALECFDERFYGFILVGVMRAEIRVVEGIGTGDIRYLGIIPAIRAENRARDAELAGLLDDLADFFIVSRNEDDVGVCRLA